MMEPLKLFLNGKSLLAAGITRINGSFEKGENVLILDQNNIQLARGLSSFSSEEIDKIKGKQSREIEKILGYLSKTEIIHKDDMVLIINELFRNIRKKCKKSV